MPLNAQQQQSAKYQFAHAMRLEKEEGEATVAAELAAQDQPKRGPKPKIERKPTAYMVRRGGSIATDMGPLQLRAGQRLEAMENAPLIGDIQRLSPETELIPLYD